jgi:hypothetical protein
MSNTLLETKDLNHDYVMNFAINVCTTNIITTLSHKWTLSNKRVKIFNTWTTLEKDYKSFSPKITFTCK